VDEENDEPSTEASPMEDVFPAVPPPTAPTIEYREAFSREKLKTLAAAYASSGAKGKT
jgi:predicted aconitase